MPWLLAKDLRILRRSPLLSGLLVVYPIVIALMIGFALSSPPSKPVVAIYNQVPPGQGTVSLGSQKVDIGAYTAGLLSSVKPLHVDSERAAIDAVRSGRALAALIVPAALPQQIRALITQGVGHPTVRLVINTRDPLERRFVEQAIDSRVAQVETAVSKQVLRVATTDLQRVLAGGSIQLLGRSVHLLGLRDSRTIIDGTIASLPRGSPLRTALGQVSDFASVAIAGLGFAKPVLGSIGTPLTVQQSQLSGRTTPTAVYAAAIAVVVSLMFVAMLLAAGMLALERTEHTYARLIRGLVSPGELLGEKVVLAGVSAALVMLAMAAGVSAFVHLDWSRFGLWVVALAFAGLAFAALGVAIGAITREVSAASLMAFLVSLPVAFVALVPASAVSAAVHGVLDVVAFCFPFRAGLDAASNAFSGTGPAIGWSLLHLAVLALVYGVLARVALRRFD
jgi:ABC-type multidrug transport system permease subunit